MQLDPEEWFKTSRGHSFSFGVAQGELEDALVASLPEDQGPYSLLFTIAEVSGPHRTFRGFHEYKEIPLGELQSDLPEKPLGFYLKSIRGSLTK